VLRATLKCARRADARAADEEALRAARRGRRARAQREESLALETALHDAVAAQDFRRAGKLLSRLRRRSLLWKLSSRLEGAVGAGRFEDAARLKRAIVHKYVAWLSAPILEALGHARTLGGRTPRAAAPPADGGGAAGRLHGGLRVGDLVRHRAGGWRGVVLGWHEQCAASPQWAAHHGVRALARGPRQRCAPPTRPRPPLCAGMIFSPGPLRSAPHVSS